MWRKQNKLNGFDVSSGAWVCLSRQKTPGNCFGLFERLFHFNKYIKYNQSHPINDSLSFECDSVAPKQRTLIYRRYLYHPPPCRHCPYCLLYPNSPLPHFGNTNCSLFSRLHYFLCFPLPPRYCHLCHERCRLCHSPEHSECHPTDPHSLNIEANIPD